MKKYPSFISVLIVLALVFSLCAIALVPTAVAARGEGGKRPVAKQLPPGPDFQVVEWDGANWDVVAAPAGHVGEAIILAGWDLVTVGSGIPVEGAEVIIKFAAQTMVTYPNTVVISNGDFFATILVPRADRGANQITASYVDPDTGGALTLVDAFTVDTGIACETILVPLEPVEDAVTSLASGVAIGQAPAVVAGPVGYPCTVYGTGFGAFESGIGVAIDTDPAVDTSGSVILSGISCNSGASWEAEFTIPSHIYGFTGLDAGGTATLRANVADILNLFIRATIAIDPTSGGPGTEVTVIGQGFGANEAIIVTMGALGEMATSPATVETNPTGGFPCTFEVPETARGGRQYSVTATGQISGGNNSKSFLVESITEHGTALFQGWNMFSFPIEPEVPTLSRAVSFADVLDDDFPAGTYVYWYDPQAGGYEMVDVHNPTPDDFLAEVGAGYWVKVFVPTLVDAEGYPAPDDNFGIHLLPGWNMIGCPFNYSVRWEGCLATPFPPGEPPLPPQEPGPISQYLYGYDTAVGGYFYAEVLEPWLGYWVKAFEECTLLIPPMPVE